MAKRKDQTKHDYIIKSFTEVLKSDQYKDTKADIDGYERPNKLYWKNGHRPDITAIYDKIYHSPKRFIFEVETKDSINDEHIVDQWQLFSAIGIEFRWRFISNSSERM